MALEIECEEPEITTCECCGDENVVLFRTIHDGEETKAIYTTTLPSHAGFPVCVLLVIGSLEDGVPATDRFSMTFQIISSEDSYGTSIIEPEDGGWDDIDTATMLTGEEARARFSKQIFEFSDLILDRDPVIRSYLDASPTVATSGPTLH
jgi:hypothetical protein